jgi:hypothetical protein
MLVVAPGAQEGKLVKVLHYRRYFALGRRFLSSEVESEERDGTY